MITPRSAERLRAIPRLLGALEKGPQEFVDELHHLIGARRDEAYAVANGTCVELDAALLRNLLRAVQGERVTIKDMEFNRHAPDLNHVRECLSGLGGRD